MPQDQAKFDTFHGAASKAVELLPFVSDKELIKRFQDGLHISLEQRAKKTDGDLVRRIVDRD